LKHRIPERNITRSIQYSAAFHASGSSRSGNLIPQNINGSDIILLLFDELIIWYNKRPISSPDFNNPESPELASAGDYLKSLFSASEFLIGELIKH
jgi:hypothetical protein